MIPRATFNVSILFPRDNLFVHTADAASTVDNSTQLNHPFANGNPAAAILVTQNWNPGGGGGVYDDHPIEVWYDEFSGRWAIFNQDLADMPIG